MLMGPSFVQKMKKKNERLRFFTSKESNMHKVTNSGRTYFNQCLDVIVWDDCDSF